MVKFEAGLEWAFIAKGNPPLRWITVSDILRGCVICYEDPKEKDPERKQKTVELVKDGNPVESFNPLESDALAKRLMTRSHELELEAKRMYDPDTPIEAVLHRRLGAYACFASLWFSERRKHQETVKVDQVAPEFVIISAEEQREQDRINNPNPI